MSHIADVMRTGEDNPVAEEDTCVRDLLEIMDEKKLGAVCIVDEDKLVGIVTDGDLRRLILRTQDTLAELFMRSAKKIMNRGPKTISPDTTLQECLKLLTKNRFWVIPVADDQKRLLGMVHMQDLLHATLVD